MTITKLSAAALMASTLLAAPALAQSTTEPARPNPPMASPASAPSVQQSDQWRGSKLVGLDIYNAANENRAAGSRWTAESPSVRRIATALEPSSIRHSRSKSTIARSSSVNDIGASLPRRPDQYKDRQWPRAIHSSRCGASAPIVVSSPWPVCTTVSAGRVEQPGADRLDDGGEVGERAAGGPGPAVEQGVAAEDTGTARRRRVVDQADAAGRVARGVAARVSVDAGDREHLAVGQAGRRARGRGTRRPTACGRRGAPGSARRRAVGQLGGGVDVVVVAVGADDGHDPAAADGVERSGRPRGRRRPRAPRSSSPTSQTLFSTSKSSPSSGEGAGGAHPLDVARIAVAASDEHDDRAQHLAALHLVEGLLDVVDADASR